MGLLGFSASNKRTWATKLAEVISSTSPLSLIMSTLRRRGMMSLVCYVPTTFSVTKDIGRAVVGGRGWLALCCGGKNPRVERRGRRVEGRNTRVRVRSRVLHSMYCCEGMLCSIDDAHMFKLHAQQRYVHPASTTSTTFTTATTYSHRTHPWSMRSAVMHSAVIMPSSSG
jgi:hypothetical protein